MKAKVIRAPKRAVYDREQINAILDKEFLCHVGFVHEGYPVVIPTLYGRKEDVIYIHGSMASRMMKDLSTGISISLSVTKVNGIVLARSAFHHSANYESVVIFGKAFIAEGQEKLEALTCISEHLIAVRWNECREPNAKEMKGTMVLRVEIEDVSAKVRVGGPNDEKEDYDLDIWAGVVELKKVVGKIIPDEKMKKDLPVPESVLNFET